MINTLNRNDFKSLNINPEAFASLSNSVTSSDISDSAFRALAGLLAFSKGGLEVRFRLNDLCKFVRQHRETTRKAIRELDKAGHIKIIEVTKLGYEVLILCSRDNPDFRLYVRHLMTKISPFNDENIAIQ